MKKIIYTRPDGGLTVVHPFEGARLAFSITLVDGTVLATGNGKKQPVDSILGRWPVAGPTAQWAETEDEFVARIAAKDVPAATSFQIVEPSAIPLDRTFRNAWIAAGASVAVDMPKAREIHRKHLRELQEPRLAAFDDAYLLADERGDTLEKQRIAAEKQKLRDVTADPAIEAAQTPEALKAIWPEILR